MLMFPQLAHFTDLSLLLRLMVAAIFVTDRRGNNRCRSGRSGSRGVFPDGQRFIMSAIKRQVTHASGL
jgi:hypothetical protein